jgi:hypothetical protein
VAARGTADDGLTFHLMMRTCVVTLPVLVALVGCEESKPTPTADTPAAASESAASEGSKGPAVQKVGEPNVFNASLEPSGDYVVGKPAKIEVVLEALGEYKCNDDYPYKFKLDDPEAGVSYPDKVAKDIKLDKKRSVLTVPFTPSSAGDKKIQGTFHFSVCNAETCKIEKRPMALTVKVAES